MTRTALLIALAASAAACISYNGPTCGEGTVLVANRCVPTPRIACGNGTVQVDGECVATLEACGSGLQLDTSGRCVLQDGVCVPPLEYDPELGQCAAPVVCGVGTEPQGAACVPACATPFNVPGPNRDRCLQAARVQFVHAYPGALRPAVDLWVASAEGEFPSGIRFAEN
ncbi:MAG: hypothetical protein AAFR44_02605, partial [Pseudomonadota bacterium]